MTNAILKVEHDIATKIFVDKQPVKTIANDREAKVSWGLLPQLIQNLTGQSAILARVKYDGNMFALEHVCRDWPADGISISTDVTGTWVTVWLTVLFGREAIEEWELSGIKACVQVEESLLGDTMDFSSLNDDILCLRAEPVATGV